MLRCRRLIKPPIVTNPAPTLRLLHDRPSDTGLLVRTRSLSRRPATERHSYTAHTISGDKGPETRRQLFAIKVSADENHLCLSFLARLPSPISDTVEKHVDPLKDIAFRAPLEINDAFEPKNVGASFSGKTSR